MDLNDVMDLYRTYKDWLLAFLMVLPRIYAFIAASTLLAPSSVPRLARTVAIFVIALPLTPVLLPYAQLFSGSVPLYIAYFAKEFALGFLMGYCIQWLLWSVQAAGNLIDNQRGAAVAASIDPLQGHEASPLGILFSQAFITYFFAIGGFLFITDLLYNSYTIWPAERLLPINVTAFPELIFEILDRGMRLAVLIGAPVVAIMFLAEFALALISRFAPQVQVFILAMPIKSALAILVLIFYIPIFMAYAARQDGDMAYYMDRLFTIMRAGAGIQ